MQRSEPGEEFDSDEAEVGGAWEAVWCQAKTDPYRMTNIGRQRQKRNAGGPSTALRSVGMTKVLG